MQDDPKEVSRLWRSLREWQRHAMGEHYQEVMPGLTEPQLQAIERLLGFDLCDSHKALLRLSAGGTPWPNEGEHTDAESMLERWAMWVSIARGADQSFGEPDPKHLPTMKTAFAYCHDRLLPLSREYGGGDGVMLDMAPGPAGRRGQIVRVDHGEGLRWFAPHLTAYLSDFVQTMESGHVHYDMDSSCWVHERGASFLPYDFHRKWSV
jgi:cell wall assembly regulator SMI1